MNVVVVGGGFAGLAAAIALQERRHGVLLLERRGVLGGRAASSLDALSGEPVGGGTHVLFGAWRETLDLLQRTGLGSRLVAQATPEWTFADTDGATSVVRCPPWRSPLHLGLGLLGMRAPWRARWDALRLGVQVRQRLPPPEWTVAEYLERTRQATVTRRALWDPLVAALLGDQPERTAARPFASVLRELVWSDRRAASLVLIKDGLAAVHEGLAAYFTARGGVLRRRALAEAVGLAGGRAAAVRYQQRAETRAEMQAGKRATLETVPADAVILAVPWSAVGPLLPEDLRTRDPFAGLARLGAAPAVTVEMWIDRVVVERSATLAREGGAGWVIDRGRLSGRSGPPQHLAVGLAPGLASESHSNAEWIALAHTALSRLFPAMADARIERAVVFKEPEAFFASDPASQSLRPGPRTEVPNLFLAGDWTDTGLPASIESAVRSGFAAARCLEGIEGIERIRLSSRVGWTGPSGIF
jgi:squalene-associated FAD-dependent desaturase